MKRTTYPIIVGILAAVLALAAMVQTKDSDRITVPLSDPSQPAQLKVNLMNGSIHVKGYAGKEVLIDVQTKEAGDEATTEEDEDADNSDKQAKRKGMRRLTNTASGLSVEEDHNEVTIGEGWRNMGRNIDLTIQVPVTSSMKLSAMNDGEITVDGVKGDLEVSNMNGPITLSNISGSVVADALNEDIKVGFTSVDPKKSMSFSSMNGDLDVTLPPDVKATLRLKNDMGEIYSDFDMKMDNSASHVEDNSHRGKGRYRVTLEKVMTGVINGGGAEMTFKNFNGDIYIRKGK